MATLYLKTSSIWSAGHPVCAEKDVSENPRERIEKG